ncbi:MAG: NlpC/P60 family protein [Candidatus Neomarinimicrobiota bacterium]|tara:strand:- start:4427 stop:5152 length:726 start_codon:yes stop_codon:yes gene_type:complete
MPKAKKKWFIIKAGSALVYSQPDFNSPCITEAIYGESCRILGHKDNWFKIECEDGYIGWVNSFYGIRSLERNNPKYLVVYPKNGGHFNSKYPFGSQMENYISGSMLINKKLGSGKVIELATQLVGTPYKWGGKSSLGFDCSGLVQSVLKICGLEIPRDAKDQIIFFSNDQIDLSDAKPGDLHFFGSKDKVTHVGFSTKGPGLLHAQGTVKLDSIDSSKKDYNKKLLDIYLSSHSIKRKFEI